MEVLLSSDYKKSKYIDITDIDSVSGMFVNFKNDNFYLIHNIDKMPPFFMNLTSSGDQWLFASSNSGLSAGRVSPDGALFPYVSVDKIEDSSPHTGSKTIFKIFTTKNSHLWEPFNYEHNNDFKIQRNLYKSVAGNKICFEEINQDLGLVFRYLWTTSSKYGFVRDCELVNLSNQAINIDILDGLQNIMPAKTPMTLQTNTSNLVDAYKWSELDSKTNIAFFTLYSGITDRPEPIQSLHTNTVFCLGFENSQILLSSKCLKEFRLGSEMKQIQYSRGIRGAYFINTSITLNAQDEKNWQIIADVDKTQTEVLALQKHLLSSKNLKNDVTNSVLSDAEELQSIVGRMDGLQLTAEQIVDTHHYANVIFNGMRGGIFDNQYYVDVVDFLGSVNHFNHLTYTKHKFFFAGLDKTIAFSKLLKLVQKQNDKNLERLCYEYLPITFSRCHGDPSRPWNKFAIKLKDKNGNQILSYQGNWRDIFQNWEALLFSYPEFIENVIAKFVNASTIDGYNPHRVTKEGIDWEVEDPDDPWSYIGYWGDHQIIYLLKLLELSNSFHPNKLSQLLNQPIFCYANVPYRIKSFDKLIDDPKNTIEYDIKLAQDIDKKCHLIGADAKLLADKKGEVYLVNLMEKLCVPLLSKLSNLVLGGGIWLNTQRPEWNDANNALVGNGMSMVTLYYLRRYTCFMQGLLIDEHQDFELSTAVYDWLNHSAKIMSKVSDLIDKNLIDNQRRFDILKELGTAASNYRNKVYNNKLNSTAKQDIVIVKEFLQNSIIALDYSININLMPNGLYQTYNLINLRHNSIEIDNLYIMLEGQVAALSSGAMSTKQVIFMLDNLFETNLYCENQNSFLLYADRELPGFLEKNRITSEKIKTISNLTGFIKYSNQEILLIDDEGYYRFHADIVSLKVLNNKLDELAVNYGGDIKLVRKQMYNLYKEVFNHKEFTGRSSTMFGFEGLGCIYWHMVSKLLLAVQEVFFKALNENQNSDVCNSLSGFYYRVRKGLGFNKTPFEYGAFPTDPYSHTTKHSGAQQPGMTGQVKEDILSRFGELGIRIIDGKINFKPQLLRACEFINKEQIFKYIDVLNRWQQIKVPKYSLAFTFCQVPIIYILDESKNNNLLITDSNGNNKIVNDLILTSDISNEIFQRNIKIQKITLTINSKLLCQDSLMGVK